MVKSDVQPSLTDPQHVIQSDAVIFGELLAWGARKAIGPHIRFSTVTLLMGIPYRRLRPQKEWLHFR